MHVSKERPVRVVVGNQLFLRGREVKVTVFGTAHIDFGWFADRSSPTEVGENLILTRSVGLIGPRSTQNSSQSWACGVQENARQYREAREGNVTCPMFLTNI